MSGVLELFKQVMLASGTYPLSTDSLLLTLVRLSAVTSAHVKTVAGCTAAAPGVVTFASGTVIANGNRVSLSGIGGITGATGKFALAGVSGSGGSTPTAQLTDPITGANITTTGTYTSGGYMINLSTMQFLSDIDSGARVATSSALGSKTFTLGVFSFAAVTWSAVTAGAACQAVMVHDNTPGSDAARPIVVFDDGATNLPVTPNGGDITYTPNASGMFKL